ncbi:hypothetical protein Hanom_Chr14g01269971 [Helianthus anomalus]
MTPEAATPVFVTLSMRMYQRLRFELDLGGGCVKKVTLSVILHLFGPFCLQLILSFSLFWFIKCQNSKGFYSTVLHLAARIAGTLDGT